jgi:predicted ATPase
MRFVTFEIQYADGWTLEPLHLDGFNLLVGVSGAGKTRIVKAIERVCAVALGTQDARTAHGSRFAVDFKHDEATYRWEAQTFPWGWRDARENGPQSLAPSEADPPLIETERILDEGRPLIERSPEKFLFHGGEIPKLDTAKSAIALLKEDPALAPLHQAFSRCVFRELETMPDFDIRRSHALDTENSRYSTVSDVGASFALSLHHKAHLLQQLFPDSWAEVEEAFCDAFPAVNKLTVRRHDFPVPGRPDQTSFLAITAEESGVPLPVEFAAMSSGMQRYLSFLVHLSFAPRGTVVLIDELESSLGINCLPAATRFLLRRAPDLQLVLTSHHPYIIEQVPTTHWKIVTRKGSHVRVLDASSIPALNEAKSRLDRFTRLINLPEYEQGIQA